MPRTILSYVSLPPLGLEQLEPHFNLLRLYKEEDPRAAIEAAKNDISGIVTWHSYVVDEALIESLPNLEIIASFSVGTDHIDLDAAKKREIIVTNTPDLVTNDTADTALALMLNVARRFVEADAYVRVGKWEREGNIGLGHRMGGKTVGIVGLGRIGKAIAKRAEAFGCIIKDTRRATKEDVDYKFIPALKDLAQISDFLVLSCAATEKTRGMIDLNVLNALGPKSYLINVARGSIVIEDDLLAALSNRAIAGAGLDVFAAEPRVPDALKTMDNVVLLPHVGTATVETRTEMAQLVIDNVLGWFDKGKVLTRVV